jgi:hypothetical protein
MARSQAQQGRVTVAVVGSNRMPLAAFALVLGVAGLARAEAVDLSPSAGRLALAGQVSYFGDDQGASTLQLVAPRIALHYAFDERWSIAGDYGVVVISSIPDQGPGETAVRSGNPTLLGVFRGELGSVRYRIGFGGAAPLAVIDRESDGRLHHAAYNIVPALDGLWDVWLWAASRGALLGFGQAVLRLNAWAEAEFETAPALMLPARDAYVFGEPVELFVPTALGLAVRLGPVTPGFRLQAVFLTAGTDALQLSLEPWLRWSLGGGFLELRYTWNVGEPVAGERGPGGWGLHLGGGGLL